MTMPPSVLIIDDHPLFRDALCTALNLACPDGARISEAGALDGGLEAIATAAPNLILLDLNIPGASGFEGLIQIKAAAPDAILYVVSATEEGPAYARAKALGATGYLPKSLGLEDLVAALTNALDGGEWFPPMPEGGFDGEARVASLTPAQNRVMNGLAAGLLNKQIAYEMGISEATVKAHMTAIMRKLGVSNRTQALLVYNDAVKLDGHSAA